MIVLIFFLFLSTGHSIVSMKKETPIIENKQEDDTFINQPYEKKIPDEGVKVHYLPLTNGEATLIRLEDGRNILIDTGARSSYTELISFLENLEVQVIHDLFLTNDRDEHSGNASDIYQQYNIKNIYVAHPFKKHFEKLFDSKLIKLHSLKRDQEIEIQKHVKVKVLNPSDQLSLTPANHSLVFQLKIWEHLFLFTSSITDEVEKELYKRYSVRSHILKVSDFGSNQASDAEFLEEVDAHVAIVFHRPGFYLDSDVLERLQETWMDVYPLKKHGSVIIVCNQEDYEVFVKKSADDLK